MIKNFSLIISFYAKVKNKDIEFFFRSIRRSSYKPSELIIIFDGPIDQILIDLINNRINQLILNYNIITKKFFFDENMGSAAAYNKAVEKSSYNIVIKCDADDFNYKYRFEKIYQKLNNGFSLCGSQMIERFHKKKYSKQLPLKYDQIKKFVKYRNPINNPSVGFTKNEFISLGGYTNIKYKEDYLLWIKWIAKYNNIINLDEVLVSTQKNSNFIRRRNGYFNIYSELFILLFIVKYRLNNFIYATIIYFIRVTILLMPYNILKKLYVRLFR